MKSPPIHFKIQPLSESGDVKYLSVQGAVDAHTVHLLEETIQERLRTGHSKIVLDLSGVTYFGSAAMGTLIEAVLKARLGGGDLVLLQPSRTVLEVFDLLGIASVFNIRETRRDADRFFAGAPQPDRR